MEANNRIKERRSIREFTNEPVSHELIEEIIDVARFAPSWKNTQIARYNVVEGALKDKLADEAFMGFEWNTNLVKKAPVVIALSYVTNRCGYERDGSFTTTKEDRWQNFDCGIAAEAFTLAASELGLGTCILGIFDDKKAKEVLSLPENQEVGCFIIAGHFNETPAAPKRKEVSELVTYLS